MKILDNLGTSIFPGTVPTGNLLWVDKVTGNDSLAARGRLTIPFQTLGNAKLAALSGDTIVVMPGTYNEKDLAKNGVNWYFMPGAIIAYSGGSTYSIFNTSAVGSACSFSILGHGEFRIDNGTGFVIASGYSSDAIIIRCEKISSTYGGLSIMGSLTIFANSVSASGPAITLSGSGTNQIRVERISSSGGQAIDVFGGTATDVVAYRIWSSAGNAVRINTGAGPIAITANELASSSDSGILYSNAYNSICTINNARIVTTVVPPVNNWKPAINMTGGTSGLRLFKCILIGASNGNPSPPAASIDSSVANTIVKLYGENVANYTKGSNITFQITAGLTVSLDVV